MEKVKQEKKPTSQSSDTVQIFKRENLRMFYPRTPCRDVSALILQYVFVYIQNDMVSTISDAVNVLESQNVSVSCPISVRKRKCQGTYSLPPILPKLLDQLFEVLWTAEHQPTCLRVI